MIVLVLYIVLFCIFLNRKIFDLIWFDLIWEAYNLYSEPGSIEATACACELLYSTSLREKKHIWIFPSFSRSSKFIVWLGMLLVIWYVKVKAVFCLINVSLTRYYSPGLRHGYLSVVWMCSFKILVCSCCQLYAFATRPRPPACVIADRYVIIVRECGHRNVTRLECRLGVPVHCLQSNGVIIHRLMLFSRRSCMMTRISYSHDGSHPTYGATYRMWFRLPVPNPNPKP